MTAQPEAAASPAAGRVRAGGLPAFATLPVAAVAAGLAALLTAVSGRYGFHRDELYFLVAGHRLAWGYVDQPPLTPLLARVSTALFGGTPAGLRVVATLMAAAAVPVVALVARELGGGRRAQVLAAGCAAASAIVLVLGHLVNTATFDLLAWLVVGWLVLRLLRTGDGRWYLAIGAAVGVALLNKRLVVLLVLALLVGLVAAGPRRVLRTWWLPAGAALALAVALPNLWWEAAHGWPQLTVAAGISGREGGENRALFGLLQVVQLSPVFVPVWVAGLVWLWRDPAVRWARPLAVAYPALVVAVLVLGGRSYYVLPLLVLVMAAGAVPVARWSAVSPSRARALAAAVAVAAAVNVVIALPVLPPRSLGVVNAVNDTQGEQLGWPEMVATVAGVWSSLPPGERARAVILVHNYGEAAAIAHYGPALGLPTPYSGHMSYGDWGRPPDSADGPVLLVVPRQARWELPLFAGCRLVAQFDSGPGVDNELRQGVVRLCGGPHPPWSMLWPSLRHY